MQLRRMRLQELLSRTLSLARSVRKPLRLQDHKPIPIPLYIPKFSVGYSHDRYYDPDHERASAAKMKAQYIQEKKGTIREIRKDARFLAAAQQKKVIQEGQDYEKRMRSAIGKIAEERVEEKAHQKAST